MLNRLKNKPTFKSLLSFIVTCSVLSKLVFFKDLSLKILNLLPSHPVLFWVNNMGLPSSIKINIDEIIKIGEAMIKKITDKNLSIKTLKKKV